MHFLTNKQQTNKSWERASGSGHLKQQKVKNVTPSSLDVGMKRANLNILLIDALIFWVMSIRYGDVRFPEPRSGTLFSLGQKM